MSEEVTKVLLVEDNPGDALLVSEFLAETTHQQFSLIAVEQLCEAISYLKETTFDVALLDLTLPDGKGLGLVRQLLAVAPDLAVVVLTGHEDEELAIEALSVGAQDYLLKGQMESYSLVRALRYSLERHRWHERIQEVDQVRVLTETAKAVAHEINNPLSVIMGYTKLLLNEVASDSPTEQKLEDVLAASEEIAKIILKMKAVGKYVTKPVYANAAIIDFGVDTDSASKPSI